MQGLGVLRWYATSIYFQPDRWPYSFIQYLPASAQARIVSELSRFYHPKLSREFVRTYGMHEWVERGLARLKLYAAANSINVSGNRAFSRSVVKLLQRESIDVVWGYDTAASDVFRFAKAIGKKTILDKTIGDPRVYNRIMETVYEEYKEFFPNRNFRIPQRVIDIEDEEYDLADRIVVGSEYCASTITSPLARPDVAKKISIIPYCYDETFFPAKASYPQSSRELPLKFLFLGQAGPRKGIHLVLKAFEKIPKSAATLTIVGDLQVPPDVFKRYSDRVEIWPTVSRARVIGFLDAADCILLPSYFEGAPITICEAMAAGKGVIQSKRANLDAIPRAGRSLDALTPEAVYAAVMELIEQPRILREWQINAPSIAERFTFDYYRSAINELLRSEGFCVEPLIEILQPPSSFLRLP